MSFLSRKKNVSASRDQAIMPQASPASDSSHAELGVVIENIPMAILLIDQERRVRRANSKAAKFSNSSNSLMVGYRAGEVLKCANSKDDTRGCGFGPACEHCVVRRTIADTFAKGMNYNEVEVKFPVVHHGVKEELDLLLSTALVNISDEPLGLLTIEDITERKKVAEKLEHLASFPRINPNPVLEIDAQGEIILHNKATFNIIRKIGVKEDPKLFLPSDMPDIVAALGQSSDDQLFNREVNIGNRTFAESINVLQKLNVIRIYANDVTDRKKREKDLEKLNHTLKAVSSSTMALTHATDETEYLKEVCRIITEDCGHAMVWIGYKEHNEEKTVRPVACAGFEEGYLETLKVTWADTERGQGPTGRAIRTGMQCSCSNMLTDPSFAPWREEALKRGYMSSIVMPMKFGDEVIGAICIYSRQPDSFIEDEIKLLAKLTEDVAYGITALRLKSAHEQSESALKQSEERYRNIVETANEGICIVSKEKSITYTNKKIAEMLDFSPDELVGKAVLDFMVDDKRVFDRSLSELKKKGVIKSQEFKLFRKDGSQIWVLANISPIFDADGGFDGALALLTDITDRKLAEEEKNNFIAIMSHELRNPLTPIMAGSQLVSAQLDKLAADGQPAAPILTGPIKVIEQQAKNMAHLLDDLLDITRISRGKIKLNKQVMNLNACLESAVKATQSVMDLQKHELTVVLPPAPLYLKADPLRLEQVVINLLNNAAKYTQSCGRISLEASRHGKDVEIVVRDNGIGIKADKMSSIFDLFSGSNNAFVTTLGELGIGLKLAKDLVSMHGGLIVPKSDGVNKGAEFTIKLPALPEDFHTEPVEKTKEESVARKQRVLIIDDNSSITSLFSDVMGYMGHDTKVANDGPSAIVIAAEYKPQVVLVDIGLPGMNGFEIAQELRRMEAGAKHKMKLIAVTGYGQEEDKKRTKAAGFDLHLVKPVSIEMLEKAFSSLGI